MVLAKKGLPMDNIPSIEELSQDLRRGLLKLLLVFASRDNKIVDSGGGKAPTPVFSVIEIDNWKNSLHLWLSEGLPLLSGLPSRSCPACSSDVSHTVFQSYDRYHFNECEECGTWYVPLVIDWTLFERYFSACPPARALTSKVTGRRLEITAASDFSRFGSYFQSIRDILPPSKSQPLYLDIGCNVGHSLTAAKSAGMLPHGVEVDLDAVALAKRNHEVVVSRVGDLPAGTYDVVSMWETLEHLSNPLLMLREAVTRLSPGGLIAVTVPNLDSPGLRVAREKCSYAYGGFDSPGHINFFNHRTIAKLFERAGLVLVEVSYEFSNNALELFGYLGGVPATDRPFAMSSPSYLVTEILNSIWPDVTMLEEFSGTLPIMQCIACRPEDLPLFSKKCNERSADRREHLITAAHHLLAPLGEDPARQIRELTEQYTKMHDHLQGEVNIRDKMLAEIRELTEQYTKMHDHLQGEVNIRDKMLAELQKKLNELSRR